LNILNYTDKILLKQQNLNNKIYAQILATAKENEEKPCYRVVNENQFNRLKNSNFKFAFFQKGENFNIVFNKNIEQKINAELKSETQKLNLN
jgi:protease II